MITFERLGRGSTAIFGQITPGIPGPTKVHFAAIVDIFQAQIIVSLMFTPKKLQQIFAFINNPGADAGFIPLTGQIFIEIHGFREDIHQLIAIDT